VDLGEPVYVRGVTRADNKLSARVNGICQEIPGVIERALGTARSSCRVGSCGLLPAHSNIPEIPTS
jgi:hypothetical protein